MSHLRNKSNEYADTLTIFDQMPKSVIAAVAVSIVSCGGDRLDEAEEAIVREWWALYTAGVVPQKPPVAEPPPVEL